MPAQARCPLLSWEVRGLALGHDVHRDRQGESAWVRVRVRVRVRARVIVSVGPAVLCRPVRRGSARRAPAEPRLERRVAHLVRVGGRARLWVRG